MEKEKDIHYLHESLEEYIRNNIYSSYLIERFSYQFKWLRTFMEANRFEMYSKEVGEKYLIFRALPGNNKRKSQASYNYDARYITLLNGMLNDEWIKKISTKDFNIPFPGALSEYVMAFLEKYAAERRLNWQTRNNYYNSLFKFCERMQFDQITSLSNITAEKVLDFVSSVQNCKDHVAIILRALLKQLYEQKFIDYHTATILDNLKKRLVKKLPSYYTSMEIRGVEETVDRKYPMGKRDYAMILLATRLGLRSSDITLLQFSNLDWDSNLIYLKQFKTKRTIELPLLTDVGEAIIDYIRHARPQSDSKYIFLRAAPPYEPLTNAGLYGIINKYFRLSNVNWSKRRHGVHAMRHSLATNMLKKGTPIAIISDSLGHADSETTMKYIHLNVDGLLKCSMNVTAVDENFYLQKGDGIYE